MRFKIPKNTEYLVWTNHSIGKMKQYQLSEQRIRRVLNAPKRKEEGIAPNTVAVMQSTGTQKHPTEIWVMYQHLKPKMTVREALKTAGRGQKSPALAGSRHSINLESRGREKPKKIRIISAWRYPGISPVRTVPDIPEEVWGMLENPDLE